MVVRKHFSIQTFDKELRRAESTIKVLRKYIDKQKLELKDKDKLINDLQIVIRLLKGKNKKRKEFK